MKLKSVLQRRFDLDEEAIQRLENFYGLRPVSNIIQNMRGLINITLMIGDHYVLTAFRQKGQEEVRNLVDLLNSMPEVPLPNPVEGREGYILILNNLPIVITERIEGKHYIGLDHARKEPMPKKAHHNAAKIFWEIHRKLQEKGLVHGDMERQNILFNEDDEVVGVVDIDAIREGNLLREFSHFLLNFAFCDPEFDPSNVDLYLGAMAQSGMIRSQDIHEIYRHMHQFVTDDLRDFSEINRIKGGINLYALRRQYNEALRLAYNHFNYG